MSMNRRQILAGAAATAAVAAMPAVAIGAAAKERDYGYLFYLDPDDHEWRPGRHLWAPEFVTIGGCGICPWRITTPAMLHLISTSAGLLFSMRMKRRQRMSSIC